MSIEPTIPEMWPIECLTLKIYIRNLGKNRKKISQDGDLRGRGDRVVSLITMTS